MTMPSSTQTNALRNERSLCDELTCGDTYRWKTQALDTETKDSLVQCSLSETNVHEMNITTSVVKAMFLANMPSILTMSNVTEGKTLGIS